MKTRGFEIISKQQFEKDCGDNFQYEDIKLPRRATAKSAGYDMYSLIDFTLQPGKDAKLPTGIKSYMLHNEALFAYPRSSLGFKYYCRLANTIGVVDADFYNNEDNEGHIWIKIRNESDKPMVIRKGEAIVQLIFQKYLLADGDSFTGDERKGGFGSTN